MSTVRFAIPLVALLLGAPTAAQIREPAPQPAIPAVLAALDTFSIVAIGDVHRTKDVTDFVLALVRHPAFPDKVNDIVVEGTNSILQSTLDRYVSGEDVPYEEARKLWRETTSPFGSSDFQAQLFQLVRAINRGRPAKARIRVIASEAPVDWNVQREPPPADMDVRERRISSVVLTEVLARNHKALMFYGGGHLRRDAVFQSAAELIEAARPHSVFIALAYVGVQQRDNCASDSVVDAKMRNWPVPAVVRVKGTWLADLMRAEAAARPGLSFLSSRPAPDTTLGGFDAYLYLGPPRLLLREHPSVFVFSDTAYLSLLHRRQRQMGMPTIDARTNPAVVASQDRDMLRCR